MCLIPQSIIFKKVKVGYELGENKSNVNHLLFMDDLKLYGKTEKQHDTGMVVNLQ